uniref:MULE transposase domain-containing protein n=1 Tax=Lactuca sativa TaxID=4236 RepID=A0A9R1UWI5_LACSA|nr:hypothetical protein LSAT_V11C700353820 [Lactuca sativa]
MYALNLLRWTPKESLERFPLYCYNLEKKNPWTVTHIKICYDNKCEYFFIVITCAKPHLKGKYLGMLLLATGMNANNQILSIVFGCGKTESRDLWIWLLSRPKGYIGYMPSLTIISDRTN